jgi:hypothetical protein
MIGVLKALVVVLAIGWVGFWLARSTALRFMREEDFVRRRNLWLGLTAVAFISPNFWVYAFVAVPLLFTAAKRDPNPLALAMVMLHLIPSTIVTPSFGFRFLDFNSFRLLVLAILIPAMLRAPAPGPRGAAFTWAAIGVVGYHMLLLGLYMPYEAVTNTVRRLFDYSVDGVVVFFAVYRLMHSPRVLREALFCLCLGAVVVAAIGVFEWARTWLLYLELTARWGIADWMAFLLRGGALRAQAATGHSMTLSYFTAFAFAIWLALAKSVPDKKIKWLATAVLIAGCYASIARAGWMMLALAYTVYLVLGPQKPADYGKQIGLIAVAVGAVLVSPMGEKFINLLPFIGNADGGNIDYRERLAELSWVLVWRNPWFGDPFVLRHMESLRQGQGIIDLVNVYASTALFSGFVGLFLLLMPYLIALGCALTVVLGKKRRDPLLHAMAAALAAAMLGTLLFISVGILAPTMIFLFWGGAAAAIRLSRFTPEDPAMANATRPNPTKRPNVSRAAWGTHATR